ncbi:GL22780 [Drosophila persimilis]|uniref:GL22780 n=1 Tax=Drosophila persimilis TaxID=7234 RepID=B4GZL2_DROPE|nr:GL22780 [Drosophila persimilis]
MNSRDRQFWTEFLLLYRSLPAVWKVRSPQYSSRAMKSAGYEQLVGKLREINSFRTNFRRDQRKREQCSEEGLPFESTLWYFDLLGFLEGQDEAPPPVQGAGGDGSAGGEAATELDGEEVTGEPIETFSTDISSKRVPLQIFYPAYEISSPKRCRPTIKEESLPSPDSCPSPPATQYSSPSAYQQMPERRTHPIGTEALAHTWSSQFQELSQRQRILARKLISDILYYGCMEQLEPSHVDQLQQMMVRQSSSSKALPQVGNVSASTDSGQVQPPATEGDI